MGINIYYLIIVTVVLFGMILPQHGKHKNIYVNLMAIMHTFVCGFRYRFLTGDLRKYYNSTDMLRTAGWFSNEVFDEGRNFGFKWIQKFFVLLTDGNFQIFLLFIAIVIEIGVAKAILKYSPKPWLSFLTWNCFGFYVFGFSAIKQALAMGILMWAYIAIMEDKPGDFIVYTLLAGCVHTPAFIFIPAYWISKGRINLNKLIFYVITFALVWIFRNPIVKFMSELYYESETSLNNAESLGGRFFLIVLILVFGIMVKGFRDKHFEKTFNLIVVGAGLQMFSGFNNVFTRLADYYLQFLIIYIPLLFMSNENVGEVNGRSAMIKFSSKDMSYIVLFVACALVGYYWLTTLSADISYSVDNYLNFRFMWEVAS